MSEIANPAKTLARRESEAGEGLNTPAQPATPTPGEQAKFGGYGDKPKPRATPPKHMLAQRDRQP